MAMVGVGSLMDLRVLFTFLLQRKLKYRVGTERTRGDGSCFLHMLIQNMKHFCEIGLWTKSIPSSVHELRRDIIQFMEDHKKEYLGYYNDLGQFVNGSHDEKTFRILIEDQAQKNSFTDEEGFFVQAACRYLEIELVIVLTSIQSAVIPSGLGGPVQRINAGDDKLKFCAGLIRNEQMRTGHYQWIYEDERGESEPFHMPAENSTLLFNSTGG